MNTELKTADRDNQRKCGSIKDTPPPRNTEMMEGAGIIRDGVLRGIGKERSREGGPWMLAVYTRRIFPKLSNSTFDHIICRILFLTNYTSLNKIVFTF